MGLNLPLYYSIKSPHLDRTLCSLQFLTNIKQYHAIWFKNKEAMAIQILVWKILGLCFAQIWNCNISATASQWAFKFWLIYFIITNNMVTAKKNPDDPHDPILCGYVSILKLKLLKFYKFYAISFHKNVILV